MGSFVDASCSCGYHGSACVGAGLETFMHACEFPCLCSHCHQVVSADLMAPQLSCPQCGNTGIIPYNDPALIGDPGDREVDSWKLGLDPSRLVVITNGGYTCPACKEQTLRFEFSGCFD
jgi:Zn finger protein HypA/HybF involved in hydrogenase expression